MLWRAISEELPGPKWAGLFAEYWPFYRKWWLKEGEPARPTYAECRRALKAHMPDLIPLYEDLCDQAGGGDLAARFLSFYCPRPIYRDAVRRFGAARNLSWCATMTITPTRSTVWCCTPAGRGAA